MKTVMVRDYHEVEWTLATRVMFTFVHLALVPRWTWQPPPNLRISPIGCKGEPIGMQIFHDTNVVCAKTCLFSMVYKFVRLLTEIKSVFHNVDLLNRTGYK